MLRIYKLATTYGITPQEAEELTVWDEAVMRVGQAAERQSARQAR